MRPCRLRSIGIATAALLPLLGVLAPGAAGQGVLERTPNLGGSWVGEPGTLHFHFLHRFQATDAPTRNVLNSPTFLLSAGLPHSIMVGARYATSSLVRPSFPNEWEFFGRWRALDLDAGAPLDVGVHGGWNQAAESLDGELSLAAERGAVRALGAVRAFSDAYHRGESRFALAGGAAIRLHEWVTVGLDLATLTERVGDEKPAWGVGLQLRVPYTPHTLSLHASNANTTTLQGASRGHDATLWGFEFTVPLTLSRYFGRRESGPPATASGGADTVAVEVGMTNRLTFEADTVRVRVGQAVRWINNSDIPHTVTADPARAARERSVVLPSGAEPFDSGDMDPGDVFVHTFRVAGEYRYFCVPHELAGMVGTVIVEP